MSGDRAFDDIHRMMMYDAHKKSALVAYGLWFFLGMFGAHRLYMGRVGSGLAMLVLQCMSFVLTFVAIGLLGYAVLGLWWLIDAFLLAGWLGDHNDRLIAQLGG